ncbi:MAG TPA: hypothetical protein O0X27_04195 [Methanocorpusculum sp.]|nr:hypothetical protein [Methanocorpusculum sp.]
MPVTLNFGFIVGLNDKYRLNLHKSQKTVKINGGIEHRKKEAAGGN